MTLLSATKLSVVKDHIIPKEGNFLFRALGENESVNVRPFSTLQLKKGKKALMNVIVFLELQIKNISIYLQSVSQIWTSLNCIWWFGFKLGLIFITAPAASENDARFKVVKID